MGIIDEERKYLKERPIVQPSSGDDAPNLSVQDVELPENQVEEPKYAVDLIKEHTESARDGGAPENVVDADERLHVSPSISQPYRWICYLRCSFGDMNYVGTGFFFKPDEDTTGVVLTCAHNLYSHKLGAATKIIVIPALDGKKAPYGVIEIGPESYRYAEEFVESPGPDTDYGMIMLPVDKRPTAPTGFGHTTLKKRVLMDRIVQVCGYPADKPRGTLWLAGGHVVDVSRRSFSYANDTAAGQSGAPIWTWARYNWVVIGIHGWGFSDHNSACRLKPEVINDVLRWANELK